jgi:DNA-binding beta-propeller fold protein YncE
MVRQCENQEYQVARDMDTAVDSPAVAEACRIFRRIGALVITTLFSILAVWGSFGWLHTTYAVPEVAETILLEQSAKPIAVAVNPNDNYVYVVNIGTGTVSVINGTELLTTIDLKTVARLASACLGPTAYGRCLNAVGVNRVTNHVYVTEWVYDVAQIISGTQVIDWVYAGKGPAGVVSHPNNGSVYVLDKWTSGVTLVQGDQDRCFIFKVCAQCRSG